MPRLPFEEIGLALQSRPTNRQKLNIKENRGLDTETLHGYVHLLCDDSNIIDRKSPLYNPPLLIKDADTGFNQIINYLMQSKFLESFNWFYNIRFDFESIIKYLPKEDLIDLYNEGWVYYNSIPLRPPEYITPMSKTENTITIKYIAKKYFGIIQGHHIYHFYDLYNFMDMSLNSASKKYLGLQKYSDVDASRLNLEEDYWKSEQERIIKYCIQDAVLTKKLADKFWKTMDDNLHLVPKRPFSKGKLAEEYFLKMCKIPTINSFLTPSYKKILEYSYNSFYGGRFELLKRGYFPKVYCYDIKSAYPGIMKDLIDFDIGKGKWAAAGAKINPDAYEGWYKCVISSNEVDFAPCVYKIKDLNVYPNGKFYQHLTKSEIDFVRENFDNTHIRVISGVEFFPKEFVYPFREEVTKLYAWKDRETDEDVKHVVKIILNSIYGKTIQVSPNKTNDIGQVFNPLYASIITARTRMKLLELGLQKPGAIIMFSTDGVHSTEPLKIPAKPKIGEFAQDFEGEGVYIMSDVYNIWTDTQIKNRIRGYNAVSTKAIDKETIYLRDILKQMNRDIYSYTAYRPVHLGESLLHINKYTKENINVWTTEKREIKINGDKKRIWDSNFKSGKDSLKRGINSFPLRIMEM